MHAILQMTMIFWNHDGATIDEGVQDLLKAPVFDGKTILEVEQDIEWIDISEAEPWDV